MNGSRTTGRRRWRGVIQITISVLLLILIMRQVQWADIWQTLRQMQPGWLVSAWCLFLLGVIVRAARWQTLLDGLGIRRPLAELASWYFVGGFFNVILPTGFGGDAVRVAELGQDTRRIGAALNSVVVDRFLGIIVLLAMGLGAAIAWPGVAPLGVVGVMAALFIGGIAVAWALRQPWWRSLGERTDGIGRLANRLRLSALADAINAYPASAILRGLAISLIFNLLQIGWNVALAEGLGLKQPLAVFLVFVPLTAVALLLPAFGGLGVRELTYAGLFGSAGVLPALAVALSLGVYIITVATGVIGGVLYLWGGLRRVRRD